MLIILSYSILQRAVRLLRGWGGCSFLFVGARYYIPTSKYFQFFKRKFDKRAKASRNVRNVTPESPILHFLQLFYLTY